MKSKETINKVLSILNDADKAYTRVIREYGTVQHTPSANNKVRQYIKDIKDMAFQSVNEIIQAEKENIITSTKAKPGVRDMAAELRRNNELILIRSLIDGSDNSQLIDLAEKYTNTEYEQDFKNMLQPKIKELLENRGPSRAKNAEIVQNIKIALDKVSEEAATDINHLENIQGDIRGLLYFNDKNFNLSAQANDDGRILHGSWNARSIESDIHNAHEGFNPLGDALEPLVVTEALGTRLYKTMRYQFDWDEE